MAEALIGFPAFHAPEVAQIDGDSLISLEDKLLVQRMADSMLVSYTAFFIRLKQLGLFHRRSTEEFISQEMRLGNGAMPQ